MPSQLFSGAVPLALFVIKATLVLVAALLGTMTLRRSTAGARHLVWLASLVGVLALPLLSRIPSLHIGVLPSSLVGMAASQSVAVARVPSVVESSNPLQSAAPANVPERAQALNAPVAANTAANDGASASSSTGSRGVADASAPSVLTTLAVVWAGVTFSLLGWLMFGALQVRRIVASSRELTSPDWSVPLCEVADRLDLEAAPRLVLSDRIEMAFACRALDPTIVLPASAESWSDDRRRAVLFHELAHVKRHDLVSHTLGRVASALYWFHPLVWTAAKQLRNESERACDDLVLACGARASEYAQHLLDMVTSVRTQGAPVMALPMARKKEFEGRMLAILDPAIRRAAPGRMQSAVVVATLGVLSLTVAAVAPAAAHSPSADVDASPSAQMAMTRTSPAASPQRVNDGASDSTKALHGAIRAETRSETPTQVQTQVQAQAREQVRAHTESALVRIESAPTAAAQPSARQAGTADLSTAIDAAARFGIHTAAAALNGLATQGAGTRRAQQADTGRIALLSKILTTDADASVRRSAAWALDDVQTPGARAALVKALQSDTDDNVREMAAWALAEHESDDVLAALGNALEHDRSARVRGEAAWAIGNIGQRSQVNALLHGAGDAEPEVRERSIWALGQLELQTAPAPVLAALNDKLPRIRTIAAWTLGEIGDHASAEPLARAFANETERSVRVAELHSMSELGDVPQSVVETALKSTDPEIRRRAVAMLAGNTEPWPWPWPQPRPNP